MGPPHVGPSSGFPKWFGPDSRGHYPSEDEHGT